MTIDNQADVIDVRDVIARVEELRSAIEAYAEKMIDWQENADNTEELEQLESLLSKLAGNGGDEKWEGQWYPITLIRDSHFEDYARELVEDICDLPKGLPIYIEVDWEATARNVRMDYSSVEFDGVTYWYR
ncbi:antirestriction protein ArdA [Burkholderia multivorans]|nr:antirestriction protein ArdA [Burkholderia multivorans]